MLRIPALLYPGTASFNPDQDPDQNSNSSNLLFKRTNKYARFEMLLRTQKYYVNTAAQALFILI